MNIARLLVETANRAPDSIAVRQGERPSLTYAGLSSRVGAIAARLLDIGVRAGDRVAIVMTNHLSYLEALYGVFWMGGVAVPINAKLHPLELAYILDKCGAAACFVNNQTVSGVRQAIVDLPHVTLINVDEAEYGEALAIRPAALAHRDGEDVAWLFYTSGTTGRPKGAMLTHNNLFLMTTSYLQEVDHVEPGDAILHAAPLSHGSGMYNFPHVARGAANVIPRSGGFNVAEIVALTHSVERLSMFAAPTMVQRLISEAPEDDPLPGLKLVIYGGGPMLVEQSLRALRRLGSRLAQIYGQGECPMTISRLPSSDHSTEISLRGSLASVGKPFHLVDIRIGDSKAPFPDGCAGEILVKSPLVMKGYWDGDDRIDSSAISEEGWLATGDVGFVDGEGFLHINDRSKDVIISGGSNVYSREIEDVLIEHPGVNEVAVLGRPHPDWGEEVVAVIGYGMDDQPDAAALDALCLARLAAFKRPRAYFFQSSLPKNAYGKIEKTALKKTLLSAIV